MFRIYVIHEKTKLQKKITEKTTLHNYNTQNYLIHEKTKLQKHEITKTTK